MAGVAAGRVAPFGHPGITASVQLPQAYRSLARPSSPLDAKASTVRLIAFDLNLAIDVIPFTPTIAGSGRPGDGIRPSIVKERSKWSEREADEVRATSGTLSRAGPKAAATRDLQKGGDPAAGSPTATLLRLRPSH